MQVLDDHPDKTNVSFADEAGTLQRRKRGMSECEMKREREGEDGGGGGGATENGVDEMAPGLQKDENSIW